MSYGSDYLREAMALNEIKVNNIPGVGCSWSNNKIVVGKALETIEEDGMHKVLCLIKPS